MVVDMGGSSSPRPPLGTQGLCDMNGDTTIPMRRIELTSCRPCPFRKELYCPAYDKALFDLDAKLDECVYIAVTLGEEG